MRSMWFGIVGLAILLFTAPVQADVTPSPGSDIYDSIDAVSVQPNGLKIDGVLHGASASTSKVYFGFDTTTAGRCDRLALLVMTKPGKYQFAIIGEVCQLILRTP
jgi:hypothetical protein